MVVCLPRLRQRKTRVSPFLSLGPLSPRGPNCHNPRTLRQPEQIPTPGGTGVPANSPHWHGRHGRSRREAWAQGHRRAGQSWLGRGRYGKAPHQQLRTAWLGNELAEQSSILQTQSSWEHSGKSQGGNGAMNLHVGPWYSQVFSAIAPRDYAYFPGLPGQWATWSGAETK